MALKVYPDTDDKTPPKKKRRWKQKNRENKKKLGVRERERKREREGENETPCVPTFSSTLKVKSLRPIPIMESIKSNSYTQWSNMRTDRYNTKHTPSSLC